MNICIHGNECIFNKRMCSQWIHAFLGDKCSLNEHMYSR